MTNKALQEKYMMMQIIDQHMMQLQQNVGAFEKQLEEMTHVEDSLKELQQVKEGTDILVPLSSGIFVKAHIGSTDEFMVNVGSSVSVKKKSQAVLDLIKEQQGEIRKVITDATGQLEQLAHQAQQVQGEINTLMK